MTTKTITDDIFSKAAFSALAETINEPKWLAEKRHAAWNIFEDTPMPTTSDEPWRRTGLKRVKWRNFSQNVPTAVSAADTLSALPEAIQAKFNEEHGAAGRIVLVNGQLKYYEFADEVAQQGVIFTDLHTAAQKHSNLVQQHLMADCVPPSDSKFAAMNAALWQNGVFLFVPRNVVIEKPFEVAILLDGEGATSVHRTLIVAEDNSQVDYIEDTASLNDDQAGLNVGVVEVIAGKNAHVRYVDVQELGQSVVNLNTKRALISEFGNVIWDMGEFGSALTKTFIDSQVIGDGANTQCNGVYFLDGTQHVDLDIMLHHIGRSTGGDVLVHGAMKDKARSVFLGMIKIDPSGQLTDSYLKNQNLLLSSTSRADSIPALQIDANDVRASHAATISQVEEEYVFYLQSRGIPRKIAVQMIVEGFFSTVFNRMKNERVKEKLMDAVLKKMNVAA